MSSRAKPLDGVPLDQRPGQITHWPEYASWCAMKSRCLNANIPGFKHYGGRGITVCEHWRESFQAFINDMGPRPTAQHSIDRRNNDGNYEPGNCRWATDEQQSKNKRNTRLFGMDGEVSTIREWYDNCSTVGYSALTCRLRSMPLKAALYLPAPGCRYAPSHIKVVEEADGWEAMLASHEARCARGRSAAEAIGNLLLTEGEAFGIKVDGFELPGTAGARETTARTERVFAALPSHGSHGIRAHDLAPLAWCTDFEAEEACKLLVSQGRATLASYGFVRAAPAAKAAA